MEENELHLEQEIFDLPDESHVEQIIEGIADTLASVSGTESLTNAQVYLSSVLVANGHIRRNQAGVEGFFSAIGEGAKKAIDYLKKLAQSIWDFFFKRDAPKLAKAAKDEVKKVEDTIKKIESGGGTPEETTLMLKDMRATVLQLTHEPDTNKAALEQILKEMDEALKKGQTEQKAALRIGVDKLPALNSKARKKIQKKFDALIGDFKRMKTAIDKMVALGSGADAHPLAKSVGDIMKGTLADVEKSIAEGEKNRDMKDLHSVKNYVSQTKHEIDSAEKQYQQLSGLEGTVNSLISELSGKEAPDEKIKAQLKVLQDVLPSIASLVNAAKQMLMNSKLLVGSAADLFGV